VETSGSGHRVGRGGRHAHFGAVFDLDDPRVQEMMERLGISAPEAKGYAEAVKSLHSFAGK